MTNKEADTENYPDSKIEDDAVLNKKSLSMDDIKFAATDVKGAKPEDIGGSVFGTAAKIIFSILLIASGIVIAIFTSYTVFGIIIGIAMVIGGIVVPFLSFGSQSKT